MSNGSLADFLFILGKPQPNWDEKVEITRDIAHGRHSLPARRVRDPDHPLRYKAPKHTHGRAMVRQDQRLWIGKAFEGSGINKNLHRHHICGRKYLDCSHREDEAVLEDWVYDCYEARELGKLVGEEEEVDMRKLERMVKVGLWCIQDESSLRPSMKKVLLMIEGTVDIPTPPSPTPFLSAI
ncbi:hypothetical protein RHSIM_Rhsim10G0139900 [Rhododendron simsii]|uniref:Uncharacterized protein n=1 Tax=Rhododendron simsii TaxID=118357 RepID=A0A834GD10_RHOSS|nr:hypothetical protein RHSIM_Rhsim10G0139900 [Rhododendron simsii]